MVYKHLKDDQYYHDLYDRLTVEDCLGWEKHVLASNSLGDASKLFLEIGLYFKKGERYAHRNEVVREWIERDRKRDEHVENAIDPQNVLCKFCEKKMELMDKSLETYFEPDKILYRYGCKECKVLKNIWEDGKTEDVIPWKCPDCSRKLEMTDKRVGKKIITNKLCTFCGYKDKYVLDLSNKRERKPNLEGIKKFNINKDRFCLSEKEGMEYVRSAENVKRLDKILKRIGTDEKMKKIKTLTLPQLERKLCRLFIKEKYVKFVLGEPKVSDDITVSFSIQDPVKKRTELSSKKLLKSTIKNALNNTNWELTASGVDYKLGVLTGKLRGIEEKKIIY